MSYLGEPVKIPDLPGKICLQKKQDRIYVMYEIRREYNREKKCTVPTRVMIGQQLRSAPEWMMPNMNYARFFSREMENTTEEEREAAMENAEIRNEFRMLQNQFDQMYYEFQLLARKNPNEIVNSYKIEQINMVLEPLRELMAEKPYLKFMRKISEPQKVSGKDGKERIVGLNYSDISLLMTQYKGAITRFSADLALSRFISD